MLKIGFHSAAAGISSTHFVPISFYIHIFFTKSFSREKALIFRIKKEERKKKKTKAKVHKSKEKSIIKM